VAVRIAPPDSNNESLLFEACIASDVLGICGASGLAALERGPLLGGSKVTIALTKGPHDSPCEDRHRAEYIDMLQQCKAAC
jgi:hypothetical protein